MDLVLQFATFVVAVWAAFVAVRAYSHNSRTKAAEFLMALHKSFFVEDTYRKVRDTVDGDSEQAVEELSRYVSEQPGIFTDFLNFFELVAFMRKKETLSQEQVEALLGYYLKKLAAKENVRNYIGNPENGFENLDELLAQTEGNSVKKER